MWTYEKDGYINLNLKVDTNWRDLWRQTYKSVIPAYHQNKEHWNTVILDGFTMYARSVWAVNEENDEKAALAGIEKTVEFFKSIDMPVNLKGLGIDPSDEDLKALALDATMQDTVKLSRIRPLNAADVEKIYRAAL